MPSTIVVFFRHVLKRYSRRTHYFLQEKLPKFLHMPAREHSPSDALAVGIRSWRRLVSRGEAAWRPNGRDSICPKDPGPKRACVQTKVGEEANFSGAHSTQHLTLISKSAGTSHGQTPSRIGHPQARSPSYSYQPIQATVTVCLWSQKSIPGSPWTSPASLRDLGGGAGGHSLFGVPLNLPPRSLGQAKRASTQRWIRRDIRLAVSSRVSACWLTRLTLTWDGWMGGWGPASGDPSQSEHSPGLPGNVG